MDDQVKQLVYKGLLVSGMLEHYKNALMSPIAEDDLPAPKRIQIMKTVESLLRTEIEAGLAKFEMPSGLLTAKNKSSKWKLASCLQKAIRRSDVAMAMDAAHALWSLKEGSYTLWRMGIIAAEDLGAGGLFESALMMTAFVSKELRASVANDKLLVWLAKIMAEANKDRTACDLVVAVDYNKNSHEHMKQAFATGGTEELLNDAGDESLSTPLRMLALWSAAGTKKLANSHMSKDNDRSVQPALLWTASKGLPVLFQYMLEKAVLAQSDCMGLSYFFMWEMLENTAGEKIALFYPKLPDDPKMASLLSSSYDQHTQTGKGAIGYFGKALKTELDIWLAGMEYQQRTRLIGATMFYYEGGQLTPRLDYEGSTSIREQSEQNFLEFEGLAVNKQQGFRDFVESQHAMLLKARRAVIRREIVDAKCG